MLAGNRAPVCLPRATWAAYVAGTADVVDYSNFKAAVAARESADRVEAYGAVWAVMFAFRQRRAQDSLEPPEEQALEETPIREPDLSADDRVS